ncbi:zinc finger BED domain-containing protein RICESLEEPER 2 [Tanacetum coccineum]
MNQFIFNFLNLIPSIQPKPCQLKNLRLRDHRPWRLLGMKIRNAKKRPNKETDHANVGKYLIKSLKKDEMGVLIKMAYCKWCPAVFKADSQRHDPTMKSEIVKYGFKHLIENGCMPMDQDEEDSQETPFQFLTPDELCDKFVEKVEKDMGLLFAMYKENIAKPPPHQSNKLGNKSSGGEDELRKYLKEPRLELEDDEDFDILTWWKLNSPRFPIVSRMAKGELDDWLTDVHWSLN